MLLGTRHEPRGLFIPVLVGKITFSFLGTRPPFVYQQVAEKAGERSRLGMSVCAIAKIVKITDKTVTKALRHHESGPKATDPSA